MLRIAGFGNKRTEFRGDTLSAELSRTIVVTAGGDEVASQDVAEGEHHHLHAECNVTNKYAALNFSTRRAMYDFAVSLLQEAVHGTGGQKEFYPVGHEGKMLVVEGVRMTGDSCRLLVFYGDEAIAGNKP